jgi:hypothetical protein
VASLIFRLFGAVKHEQLAECSLSLQLSLYGVSAASSLVARHVRLWKFLRS